MATVSIVKATYSDPEIETLLAPFGGMGHFVKKNEKVLLKVNLLSAKAPEKAVTTHPEFVRAVAKSVKKAGGKPFIGDSPAGTFSKRSLTKAKYHAQFPRRVSFADMMLDILTILKPQLYIMDGILGMQGQGPGSGDPVKMDLVLASTDHVAMDIAVCKILGIEPVGIPALKMAKIRGLWPEKIDYPVQRPADVAYKGFRLPNTADHLLTGKKPPRKSPVISDKCTACGDCESICPKNAVKVQGQMAEVTYSKCIRCFCCHEVCPEDAIMLRSLKLN